MFDLALTVVLALHLVCVNLASAGPFLAVWLFWRAWRRHDDDAALAGRHFIGWSLASLGAGIVSGAAALGLLWAADSDFFGAAARLPVSRYWFGAVELVFYAVCLLPVLAFARADDLRNRRRVVGLSLLLVLAGLDLVYHFPPLFVGLNVLASRPYDWIGQVRFVELLVDPQVAAMVGHFVLASAASGGLMLMLVCRRTATGETLVRWGGWITLVATLAQIPVGVVLLFRLPEPARDAMLGADPAAGGLLALSLLATLGLLERSLAIALGDTQRSNVQTAVGLFALIVLLMVSAQQQSAQAQRALVSRPPDTPTAHSYGVAILAVRSSAHES